LIGVYQIIGKNQQELMLITDAWHQVPTSSANHLAVSEEAVDLKKYLKML